MGDYLDKSFKSRGPLGAGIKAIGSLFKSAAPVEKFIIPLDFCNFNQIMFKKITYILGLL